jgi:hypothetical protein
MKLSRFGLSTAAVFVLAGVSILTTQLPAQDNSSDGKITVPLSSPSQPATIKLTMITGSVTLTAGTGPQVVVDMGPESNSRLRGRRRETNPPPGMHRIDTGDSMEVVEDHNVVTIKPGLPGQAEHINIQAPVNTSVQLKAISCNKIDVSGISGDLEVECTNGAVELKNVSGSVVAHSINGSITASLDKVSPDKAMSFTSLNGKIDVTLPADTKARLRLKTNNGAVYTDFDVKMEADNSKPVVEDGRGQGGRYRIRMDRGVYGSINGGGPEYLFQTMNGDILIHKK